MCMSNALYCVVDLHSVAIFVQAACVHLRNGVLEQNGYKIYCSITVGWRKTAQRLGARLPRRVTLLLVGPPLGGAHQVP